MAKPGLNNDQPPEAHVPALVEQLGDAAHVLDSLTIKQRRFVEEYLVDMDATNAARRAGYAYKQAKKQGYDNLRNTAIVDAITAVMAKRSKATAVNRSWVMAQLVDTHNVAMKGKGAPFVSARLRALELIGKHVDVRAFRAGVGSVGGDEDDGRELWDLSLLDDEEFEVFERLLAKVTIFKPHADGEGGTSAEAGPGAPSSGPGGDSVAL